MSRSIRMELPLAKGNYILDLPGIEPLLGESRLQLAGRFILEDILQPKLNLPLRGTRGIDPAGVDVPRSVAVEQAGVGNARVGMIRQIEKLRTELDPLGLGYLEILASGKIELRQARANDGISRDCAHESHLITQVGP